MPMPNEKEIKCIGGKDTQCGIEQPHGESL